MIIYHYPKFYLRVDFTDKPGYTESYDKKFGIDLNRDCVSNQINGFRLWSLKETLDAIKKALPDSSLKEFDDKVTPQYVLSLLTTLSQITNSEEVKTLRNLANGVTANDT